MTPLRVPFRRDGRGTWSRRVEGLPLLYVKTAVSGVQTMPPDSDNDVGTQTMSPGPLGRLRRVSYLKKLPEEFHCGCNSGVSSLFVSTGGLSIQSFRSTESSPNRPTGMTSESFFLSESPDVKGRRIGRGRTDYSLPGSRLFGDKRLHPDVSILAPGTQSTFRTTDALRITQKYTFFFSECGNRQKVVPTIFAWTELSWFSYYFHSGQTLKALPNRRSEV